MVFNICCCADSHFPFPSCVLCCANFFPFFPSLPKVRIFVVLGSCCLPAAVQFMMEAQNAMEELFHLFAGDSAVVTGARFQRNCRRAGYANTAEIDLLFARARDSPRCHGLDLQQFSLAIAELAHGERLSAEALAAKMVRKLQSPQIEAKSRGQGRAGSSAPQGQRSSVPAESNPAAASQGLAEEKHGEDSGAACALTAKSCCGALEPAPNSVVGAAPSALADQPLGGAQPPARAGKFKPPLKPRPIISQPETGADAAQVCDLAAICSRQPCDRRGVPLTWPEREQS